MEHLNGCCLVANTLGQKPAKLLPPLVLRGCALRGFQALSAPLGSDRCGEIGELLGQQSRQLVAGLRCLQSSRCRLARCHKRRHLRTVGVDIGDDAGLHPQRILQRRDRGLPASLRV
jgi:hypothetical protein